MEVERALEGLVARLQHILDILAEGRKSLAVPEASEWKALALSRWQLQRALHDFNVYKAQYILEPILQGSRPDHVDAAASLLRDNARIEDTYSAFVAHWVLNCPIAADAPYRAAALEMAREIERHVVADVQRLEQLVEAVCRRKVD